MTNGFGSNISSLIVQSRLAQSTDRFNRSIERLSSGLRINRASDDAAGLSIATSLRADGRIYTQAIRNVNDGISYLNIADGSLGELTTVLTRLKELATQASNGSFSLTQRLSLDKEATQLTNEFNRIIASTSLNGRSILDGSVSQLRIQAGRGLAESLGLNLTTELDRNVGVGTFSQSATSGLPASPTGSAAGDFNRDGNLDFIVSDITGNIFVRTGNGDGTFGFLAGGNFSAGNKTITSADFNGDGKLDLIAANSGASGAQIVLGNGDGTFGTLTSITTQLANDIRSGDFNGDGTLDFAMFTASSNELSVFHGNGDGTFDPRSVYTISASATEMEVADLNGDGITDIAISSSTGNALDTYMSGASGLTRSTQTIASVRIRGAGDFDQDGYDDLVVSGASNHPAVYHGSSSGALTLGATYSFAISNALIGDYNNDGLLDFAANETGPGTLNIMLGNGEGEFTRTTPGGTSGFAELTGDFNKDGVADIVSLQSAPNNMFVYLGTSTTSTSIERFDLNDRVSALSSLDRINSYFDRITLERGQVGSNLARLETILRNLEVRVENTAQAEGRISNIDVAEEAAILTKERVLQQIASSVLAQANQLPALSLTLLRNSN